WAHRSMTSTLLAVLRSCIALWRSLRRWSPHALSGLIVPAGSQPIATRASLLRSRLPGQCFRSSARRRIARATVPLAPEVSRTPLEAAYTYQELQMTARFLESANVAHRDAAAFLHGR